MNSSRRISPGGMGSSSFLALTISSVVIDDLNVVGIPFDPRVRDPSARAAKRNSYDGESTIPPQTQITCPVT